MLKIIGVTLGLFGVLGYGLSFLMSAVGIGSVIGGVFGGVFLGFGIAMLYTLPAWNALLISQIKNVTSRAS